MAEGNPRETLLKYDEAIESLAVEDQPPSQRGASQKGFSSNYVAKEV